MLKLEIEKQWKTTLSTAKAWGDWKIRRCGETWCISFPDEPNESLVVVSLLESHPTSMAIYQKLSKITNDSIKLVYKRTYSMDINQICNQLLAAFLLLLKIENHLRVPSKMFLSNSLPVRHLSLKWQENTFGLWIAEFYPARSRGSSGCVPRAYITFKDLI